MSPDKTFTSSSEAAAEAAINAATRALSLPTVRAEAAALADAAARDGATHRAFLAEPALDLRDRNAIILFQ